MELPSKRARLTPFGILTGLILSLAHGQSPTCVNFPAGFVPFSSISYVTAANSAGDHLVVGVPAPGALSLINASIPLPASTNQTFCDAQVQLGPQQLYPNVYIPTVAELTGNFSAFAGLFVNAATGVPYPNGQVPAGQLANLFAWRIGPAQVTSTTQGWSPTVSMTEPRSGHAAVLLPSGKVLVVSPYDTSADIYDPATGAFASAGQMVFTHGTSLTATLLRNGQVLIEGGSGAPTSAELYDPVSGKFVATGSLAQPHGLFQSATLLQDGRVLVVGGLAAAGGGGTPTDPNAGAEIYDPKTGAFSAAGPMTVNRRAHTTTLLADGRVLIAGGETGSLSNCCQVLTSAEIYNPTTGVFSATGSMLVGRNRFFAILLTSGKVLLGGGFDPSASAEIFDPVAGEFSLTGSLNQERVNLNVALLSTGQVLVAGGNTNTGATNNSNNSAELYSPATGTFSLTGKMGTTRSYATTTVLLDGRVLETGGNTGACCNVPVSSAELYTPTTEGLVTSQTGLTFRVAAGNPTTPPQTIAVLSNTDTIPWSVSTHTYQGGSWLSVALTSGTSAPGAAPTTLTITTNPSGLSAQDYYGAVTLTPTDGKHPPITIAIVLSIVPAGAAAPPGVTPSGLLFLGTPGATLKPQSFTISNLTSKALTFTGVATATPAWFDFALKTGTVAAAGTASITVTPAASALAAGVYPASIKLLFGDGSTQTVALLLVISATAGSERLGAQPFAIPKAATTCTASKLLPVFTTIGAGFNTPAAWPTPLIVQVVDDCGAAFNSGSVIVSFTNGDPPINLLSIGSGSWAATWVPQHNTLGFTVRADAQKLPLSGSVQVTGQVFSNPTVPVVSQGGIVSNADYASAPALGLLVSIFGNGLADGSAQFTDVPLPQQLGSTSVVLAGRRLPLLYVSDTQVDVAIPYDMQINTTQQLVVLRGNAVSVPVPLAVFASEPSILSASGSGSGQGLIYNALTGTRADTNSPLTGGDYFVIYALGLGAVTPSLAIENGAPSSPYEYAVAPVTVTVGGVPAAVAFAGLTPGYVGLYQVNAIMPAGVAPGSQVPVTVSVSGKSGQGNVTIAIK
jgi:uncharacterized protein (TIGR03437 family)